MGQILRISERDRDCCELGVFSLYLDVKDYATSYIELTLNYSFFSEKNLGKEYFTCYDDGMERFSFLLFVFL
jgi:hypothetical protein